MALGCTKAWWRRDGRKPGRGSTRRRSGRGLDAFPPRPVRPNTSAQRFLVERVVDCEVTLAGDFRFLGMRIRVTLTPRFPPPARFYCGSGPVPMSCCGTSAAFGWVCRRQGLSAARQVQPVGGRLKSSVPVPVGGGFSLPVPCPCSASFTSALCLTLASPLSPQLRLSRLRTPLARFSPASPAPYKPLASCLLL